MRDGRAFAQVREIVTSESFANYAYGYAWLACEHLHEQGLSIDPITVGDELERMNKMQDFVSGQWSGRALLGRLRQNGEPRHVLSYAENVQDMAIKRKLDVFLTKAVMWAKNGRRAKDILQDVESEMSRISLYSADDEYTVPIGVGVSEAYDWTDAAAHGRIVGVPTGLVDVDRTLGSLMAGNVYLVAARPGQGKTGFVLSVALHVAKHGKRVGVFSLEMSRQQVAQRLISQAAEVDLHRAILGKLEEQEWPKYTHGMEMVASLPIIINDLSSININQITQVSRKIKAAGGLDLLIVDYIQLATADNKQKYERREQEVSTVSRGLKYLARELNVPILVAAQLNRDVEKRGDKKPILSDLRESGSLEQDAYAVMFIYRKEETPSTAELIIAKHRNGPVGVCTLVFRGALAKFDNAFARKP
jgi:replicative DNA helicase